MDDSAVYVVDAISPCSVRVDRVPVVVEVGSRSVHFLGILSILALDMWRFSEQDFCGGLAADDNIILVRLQILDCVLYWGSVSVKWALSL